MSKHFNRGCEVTSAMSNKLAALNGVETMRKYSRSALLAALLFSSSAPALLSASSVAFADPGNGNGVGPTNCGNCQGNNGVGLGNIGGAPSPQVDMTLGLLLAGGVVALVRLRRSKKNRAA